MVNFTRDDLISLFGNVSGDRNDVRHRNAINISQAASGSAVSIGGGIVLSAAHVFRATVSEETDARLRGGATKLRPDEWTAGDIPWLIELIAPFGGQEEILKDLSSEISKGKPFTFHTTTPQGRVVKTWPENTETLQ